MNAVLLITGSDTTLITTGVVFVGTLITAGVTFALTRTKQNTDQQAQLANNAMSYAHQKDEEIKRLIDQIKDLGDRSTALETTIKGREVDSASMAQRLLIELQVKNQLQMELNFLREGYQKLYERFEQLVAHVRMLERHTGSSIGTASVLDPPLLDLSAAPLYPIIPTATPPDPGTFPTSSPPPAQRMPPRRRGPEIVANNRPAQPPSSAGAPQPPTGLPPVTS